MNQSKFTLSLGFIPFLSNTEITFNISSTLLNLVNVLVVIICALLAVAFMTIIERKQLAAHQRRQGPNIVG